MSTERRQDFTGGLARPRREEEEPKREPTDEELAARRDSELRLRFHIHRNDDRALIQLLRNLPFWQRMRARTMLFQSLGGIYDPNAGTIVDDLWRRAFGPPAPQPTAETTSKAQNAAAATSQAAPTATLPPRPQAAPKPTPPDQIPRPAMLQAGFIWDRTRLLERTLRRLVEKHPALGETGKDLAQLLEALEPEVVRTALVQLGCDGKVPSDKGSRRYLDTLESGIPGGLYAFQQGHPRARALTTQILVSEHASRLPLLVVRDSTPATGDGENDPRSERLDEKMLALLGQGGRRLDAESLHKGKSLLGEELAGVRLHTDAEAARLAAAHGAVALVYGTHVYFGARQFAPRSRSGEQLILHALMNVVQHQVRRREDAAYAAVAERALSQSSDAAQRDAATWLAGRKPSVVVERLASLVQAHAGDVDYLATLASGLNRAGKLVRVLETAAGQPDVWSAVREARESGLLDGAGARAGLDSHAQLVAAGLERLHDAAGRVHALGLRGLDGTQRIFGQARSWADGLTGGVTSRLVARIGQAIPAPIMARHDETRAAATHDEDDEYQSIADLLDGMRNDSGTPLPPAFRKRMESSFAHDFSHVRLHVGRIAETATQALGAKALSVGSHIFVQSGRYTPGTLDGDRVLGHELMHVKQYDQGQLPSVGGRPRVSRPDEPAEVEARAAEERVASNGTAEQNQPPQSPKAPSFGDQISPSPATDMAAAVARRISPGLADIIQQGPTGLLRRALEPAVSQWVSGITGGVDLGGLFSRIGASLQSAYAVVQGARAGDAHCCEVLTSGIQSLRELGQAFLHNPAIEALRNAFARVADIVGRLTRVVLAPVFDVVRDVVGGAWNAIQSVASTVAGWVRAVREASSSAFDWIARQLGFPSGTGEGGILDWLTEQARRVWAQLRQTLQPVLAPLQTVGGIVLALSPLGQIYLVVKYAPRVVQAIQWLWTHRNDPNIVKSAHAQMGHTILPQLLEAGQGFSGTLSRMASGFLGELTRLGTGLGQLLEGLTGIPILSAARGFVQRIAHAVQGAVTWVSGTLSDLADLADGAALAWRKLAQFLRPYKEVLCSIGLAIASPPMIPVILAGWAWRWLPDCIKPPIIDLLLDIVLTAVDAVPWLPMFGLLWPLLKPAIMGFLRGLRAQPPNVKITVTNKLAQILSGASPEFLFGFVKGLLSGVWDGIRQPFELIWMLAEGLVHVVDYFRALAGAGMAPAGATASPATPPSPNASPQTAQPASAATVSVGAVTPDNVQSVVAGVVTQLGQAPSPAAARGGTAAAATTTTPRGGEFAAVGATATRMAGELGPPVEQVGQNFWPAVQALFRGGSAMTLDDFIARLSSVWEAARGAISRAGGQLAQMICDYFMRPTAEGSLGEGVGYVVGMFAFQALLDYLSAGTWQGAMAVVSALARFLNWPMAALGEAMQLLSRLGRYILDGVRRLGGMIREAASGALREVLAALRTIGTKLGEFADELLGRFGGRAAEAAEGAGVRSAESAGVHTAESAGVHSAEGEAVRTAEGTADDVARAERSAVEREALKASELPQALGVARAITQAAEVGRVPAVALTTALDALKGRYRWIEFFEAVPEGPRRYDIYLIASRNKVKDNYTEQENTGGATAKLTPAQEIRLAELERTWKTSAQADLEELVELRRLRGELSFAPNTPEHKLERWREYLAGDNAGWSWDRWSANYHNCMENAIGGLAREAEYRTALGGENRMLTTSRGPRQIDCLVSSERKIYQIKMGHEDLTTIRHGGQLPNLEAILRDEELIAEGYQVIWVLESGGSGPLLARLREAGIEVVVGKEAAERLLQGAIP